MKHWRDMLLCFLLSGTSNGTWVWNALYLRCGCISALQCDESHSLSMNRFHFSVGCEGKGDLKHLFVHPFIITTMANIVICPCPLCWMQGEQPFTAVSMSIHELDMSQKCSNENKRGSSAPEYLWCGCAVLRPPGSTLATIILRRGFSSNL